MGKKKFVTVYVLAGMAGNILSCIVNPRTPVSHQSGQISVAVHLSPLHAIVPASLARLLCFSTYFITRLPA